MVWMVIAITSLVFFPEWTWAAGARCSPKRNAPITLCINISDPASSSATARVYEGTTDKYGVFNVSVSIRDKACAKGVTWTNCGDTGDFITPKGDRKALCSVDKVPATGAVCGDRKLAPGLKNVTVFDSEMGAWAVHYYSSSGDSHGCGRLVGSTGPINGLLISDWLETQHAAGKTVYVRVLYPEGM